jgi:toxin ParE1/3/4
MQAEPRQYRLSPLAERDLEDIWTYTLHSWSREQADHYHGDIIAAIEDLARGDRNGRDASDIRPGYIKYAVGRHFLFYRFTADSLDVIRVLHQSMDLPARLRREEM